MSGHQGILVESVDLESVIIRELSHHRWPSIFKEAQGIGLQKGLHTSFLQRMHPRNLRIVLALLTCKLVASDRSREDDM